MYAKGSQRPGPNGWNIGYTGRKTATVIIQSAPSTNGHQNIQRLHASAAGARNRVSRPLIVSSTSTVRIAMPAVKSSGSSHNE
jgi:hypothetical protein